MSEPRREMEGEPQAYRLGARERYHRDPMFRQLVTTLRALIERGEYTPTELREACIYAATLVEMEHARPARVRHEP